MSKKKSHISSENLKLTQKLGESISGNIFEQMVEHFPDIIHSVDDKGRIISVNAKASELLGYSKQELIGKSIFEIYADEVLESLNSGFQQLKREGIINQVESKLKAKSGEVIDVEIRSLSLYNEAGEFIKTFSIIRDLRKQNSMKSQLVQQSKLAAIGELASGIMHDIRNPLTVITSCNDFIVSRVQETGDLSLLGKCHDKIKRASGKIQRLSDHLRSFSRLDDQHKEQVSLSSILDDCLLMLDSRIKESGATVARPKLDSTHTILARENQIEQVLINLLGNATDAVTDCEKREIVIAFFEEEKETLITISDSGPGIDPKDMDRIFEAFFTTKPKGVGTGLGLSMCCAIIADHGGLLTVESTLKVGTTFTLRLPKS